MKKINIVAILTALVLSATSLMAHQLDYTTPDKELLDEVSVVVNDQVQQNAQDKTAHYTEKDLFDAIEANNIEEVAEILNIDDTLSINIETNGKGKFLYIVFPNIFKFFIDEGTKCFRYHFHPTLIMAIDTGFSTKTIETIVNNTCPNVTIYKSELNAIRHYAEIKGRTDIVEFFKDKDYLVNTKWPGIIIK